MCYDSPLTEASVEDELWMTIEDYKHLGSFVEVEGPDGPTIQGVCEDLGLDPKTHESRSYPAMVAAKRT